MFRQMQRFRKHFFGQTTRCTLCLRPTGEETIPPEQLIQGNYVCTTCQQALSPKEITTALQALGLIPTPPVLQATAPLTLQDRYDDIKSVTFRRAGQQFNIELQQIQTINGTFAGDTRIHTTIDAFRIYNFPNIATGIAVHTPVTNEQEITQVFTNRPQLIQVTVNFLRPMTMYILTTPSNHHILTDNPTDFQAQYRAQLFTLPQQTYHLVSTIHQVRDIEFRYAGNRVDDIGVVEPLYTTLITYSSPFTHDFLEARVNDVSTYYFTHQYTTLPQALFTDVPFLVVFNDLTTVYQVQTYIGRMLTDDLEDLDRTLRARLMFLP